MIGQMKQMLKLRGFKLSRKEYAIITVALAVICAAVYVFLSVRHWQQLETRTNHVESVYAEQMSVVHNDTTTADKLRQTQTALSMHNDDLCTSTWWLHWQTSLVDSLGTLTDKCLQNTEHSQNLHRQLSTLNSLLEDEQKIIAIVAPLKSVDTKEIAAKDWSKQQAKVKVAQQEVSALDIGGDYEAVAQKLTKQLGAMQTVWDKVQAANKKENRAAYETAVKELQAAYDELSEVAVMSDKLLSKQLQAL